MEDRKVFPLLKRGGLKEPSRFFYRTVYAELYGFSFLAAFASRILRQ
jgi:hypothetical protein